MRTNSIVAALTASVCMIALATPAQAQQRQFDIPAGSLKAALDAYGRQSGRPIIYRSEDIRGAKSNGYRGSATADEALQAILVGTGFLSKAGSGNSVAIVRNRQASSAITGDGKGLNPTGSDTGDILVVGTHIRGAVATSPVVSVGRTQIAERGITDLGGYARSVPQNYPGGQNPGVISSFQEGSENVNSSSAMNLRGLGADATLTLVNGHRVAYDAVAQGVDISAIPLVAIEQVDIIADGSSALYGSDAVGGVANVVLRKDFSGLETSARIGGATDGGSFEQQYSGVTGAQWGDGGLMVAGDYNKSTAIIAGQRSITSKLFPTSIIYPPLEQVSVVATGHQTLSQMFSAEIDAQFSRRTTKSKYAFTATSNYNVSGNYGDRSVRSYSITPKLIARPGGDFVAFLTGTLGSSDSHSLAHSYSGGRETVRNDVTYVNDLRTVEAGGDGTLFSLPGGPVKVAIGVGYRFNSLSAKIKSTRGTVTSVPTDYVADQNVYYGYGELSLPIVGSGNAIPMVEALRFTGALRYEHYNLFGGTATPKLGLLYQPVAGVQLSTTWGKSFKAPTLAQASRQPTGDLLPADFFVPEAPGGKPVLLLGGAIPGIGPERATSWNTTATFDPHFLPGLRLQVSYFDTRLYDPGLVKIALNGSFC